MSDKQLPPKCANPHCPQRRGVWRTLFLERPPGVLLHDQWLCSPECLKEVLEQSLLPLVEGTRAAREVKAHRFPLGLLMHSLGLISKESLQDALQAQRETGEGRLGDWLRRQGAVTERQITQALAMQSSLPVYPLEKWEGLNCARLIPWALLDSFRMLPVHCSASGLLYVAFSSRVNYTVLYAIEQMLDFRTQPCFAQESYIVKALETLHQQDRSTDIPMEGPLQASIISGATLQEVSEFGAREVRVAGCTDNIWVRLRALDTVRDLLFHRTADRAIAAVSCRRCMAYSGTLTAAAL